MCAFIRFSFSVQLLIFFFARRSPAPIRNGRRRTALGGGADGEVLGSEPGGQTHVPSDCAGECVWQHTRVCVRVLIRLFVRVGGGEAWHRAWSAGAYLHKCSVACVCCKKSVY